MTIDSFQVKSFHTLEFNKVCEKLASFAVSDAAKDAALHLMPTDSIREANQLSDETSAAFRLACRKGNPSFSGVHDV